MIIDTSDIRFLPESKPGRSYLFRYKLQITTQTDLFNEEKGVVPFQIKLLEINDFYQCTLMGGIYSVGIGSYDLGCLLVNKATLDTSCAMNSTKIVKTRLRTLASNSRAGESFDKTGLT